MSALFVARRRRGLRTGDECRDLGGENTESEKIIIDKRR